VAIFYNTFVPGNIGGDALFARAGVQAADATAASLAFMAALMLCGLVGGAVHLLGPLDVDASLETGDRADG
jgi:hypothetical protein